MKTFLSKNQRWPFSRFSLFITLEVGDALVLSYLGSSGVFVSGADQKNQKNDFDANLITNLHRNNF